MSEDGYTPPVEATAPKKGDIIGVAADGDMSQAAIMVEPGAETSLSHKSADLLKARDIVGKGDTAAIAI